MKAIYLRYRPARRKEKEAILDEFCKASGFHRKHAIRLLGRAPSDERPEPRQRPLKYGLRWLCILQSIWEASGYLWSRRLKAARPLWMPWVRRRFKTTAEPERQWQAISPAQIDRRRPAVKRQLKKRIDGRTKPGTLLKHQIPIKTEAWNVRTPGYVEIDLVSHSGDSAQGEFAYTRDVTDIHTAWVERRARLGQGQHGVGPALEAIAQARPFKLLGIDSDNGSEFINAHLYRYCKKRGIQFTRGRPYKKDDHAHIEQKNWTHVRKLLGYGRYDTAAAAAAVNNLYRHELRDFQNFFQPSVKLIKKVRIGSRLQRVYDAPKTPWQRVRESKATDRFKVARLKALCARRDPFELAQTIDRKLQTLSEMATSVAVSKRARRASPGTVSAARAREKAPSAAAETRASAAEAYPDLPADPLAKLQRAWEREVRLETTGSAE